jgi:hypothetical protein
MNAHVGGYAISAPFSACDHADVIGFGVLEHHGGGAALPLLVPSGNLNLEIW